MGSLTVGPTDLWTSPVTPALKEEVRSFEDEATASFPLNRPLMSKLQAIVKRIKQDTLTIYFVARDPNTPVLVRLLALAVAAYAISPIDLIPDFIPILGYLDDVILLPLGILAVIKLMPTRIIEANRAKAAEVAAKPVSHIAAAVVVLLWLLCGVAVGYWFLGGVGGA